MATCQVRVGWNWSVERMLSYLYIYCEPSFLTRSIIA